MLPSSSRKRCSTRATLLADELAAVLLAATLVEEATPVLDALVEEAALVLDALVEEAALVLDALTDAAPPALAVVVDAAPPAPDELTVTDAAPPVPAVRRRCGGSTRTCGARRGCAARTPGALAKARVSRSLVAQGMPPLPAATDEEVEEAAPPLPLDEATDVVAEAAPPAPLGPAALVVLPTPLVEDTPVVLDVVAKGLPVVLLVA